MSTDVTPNVETGPSPTPTPPPPVNPPGPRERTGRPLSAYAELAAAVHAAALMGRRRGWYATWITVTAARQII